MSEKVFRFIVLCAVAIICAFELYRSAVSVRDANFDVIKVLSETDRATFATLWNTRREVDTPIASIAGTRYYIDVTRGVATGRWIYWTSGYVTRVDIAPHEVYKLDDPTAFDKVIGVR